MSKKLKIGIFGFGCVGQGLYHVIGRSSDLAVDIVKIAVKNKGKCRSIQQQLITYDKWDILHNKEIDVFVELIDDADEAFQIVSYALKQGKHVVSANKKMLALHREELYQLQSENNCSLLYEGAVAGSIPILRTLEEYYGNEQLKKISGILNGTTNYILSKTGEDNLSYQEALLQAQLLGYAESNPENDVEAFDSKYKVVLLAFHAFGLFIPPAYVLNLGITHIRSCDLQYAREKGFRIKLCAVLQRTVADGLVALVSPLFVSAENPLHHIDEAFNGVIVEGEFSGAQLFQGKGAGSYPTGAAVLSDIYALAQGYRYECKKYRKKNELTFTNDVCIDIYLRYHCATDLEKITFEHISEKFSGHDAHCVIGRIFLSVLLKQQSYIKQNKLFVVRVNECIYPVKKKQGDIHAHEVVTH